MKTTPAIISELPMMDRLHATTFASKLAGHALSAPTRRVLSSYRVRLRQAERFVIDDEAAGANLMIFHTDHHFVIGRGHMGDGKPCQDHALSGVIGDYAYAVVSDGCSGAGQTDIGSRIITRTTAKAINILVEDHVLLPGDDEKEWLPDPVRIYGISNTFGSHVQYLLGLSSFDMMATQLFAIINKSGRASLSVYGDGAVVLVSRTGIIRAYVYEWARNAPFYPYQNREKFTECHGGENAMALLENFYQIAPNGEVEVAVEHPFSVKQGCDGITLSIDVNKTDTALICLFTDGVKQVDNMALIDVLQGLVGFKTLSGEFVKRRLIRFLQDSQKKGLGPIDDLGLAVIAIEK